MANINHRAVDRALKKVGYGPAFTNDLVRYLQDPSPVKDQLLEVLKAIYQGQAGLDESWNLVLFELASDLGVHSDALFEYDGSGVLSFTSPGDFDTAAVEARQVTVTRRDEQFYITYPGGRIQNFATIDEVVGELARMYRSVSPTG